jgi:glutathione S-transferase
LASENSYKIALYLNCAGLDWEPVGVDFAGGVTRDANGAPTPTRWARCRCSRSMAGECPSRARSCSGWPTNGKFAPADDESFEARRWLFFDNHRFTNNYAMHRFQNSFTPRAADPAVMAFLRARVESTFAIVEKHLTDRPFVLGERATIVDCSMAGYVYYPAAETGFDIAAQFPAIEAWRRRVAALPGWKPPYAMMPVGHSPPVRVS